MVTLQLDKQTEELEGSVLFLLGEQGERWLQRISPRNELQVVTNRADIKHRNADLNIELADFTLLAEKLDASFDHIVLPVVKEKAQVHYCINQASRLLKENGCLWLIGHKNEGAKTYIDKSVKLLGGSKTISRQSDATLVAGLLKESPLGAALDDQRYSEFKSFEFDGLPYLSKPGIYGWKKCDAGSQFLVQTLAEKASRYSPKVALDLGCGYGYLATQASRWWPECEWIASDNNVAAVTACEKNFSALDVKGKVKLDDVAQSVNTSVDMIICNPPFHAGFGTDTDIHSRFLQQANRLLKPNGVSFWVVNAFLPFEKEAAKFFTSIDVLANSGKFKVIKVS